MPNSFRVLGAGATAVLFSPGAGSVTTVALIMLSEPDRSSGDCCFGQACKNLTGRCELFLYACSTLWSYTTTASKSLASDSFRLKLFVFRKTAFGSACAASTFSGSSRGRLVEKIIKNFRLPSRSPESFSVSTPQHSSTKPAGWETQQLVRNEKK
eukprot:1190498-Prorocentrum_minimum.AAC.2